MAEKLNVGKSDLLKTKAGRHSGGTFAHWQVALARVLILKPKVLLMDEPFGALDSQTREEMQGLLLHLWEQLSHTIVFVTHDVSEALLLADRVLVMSMSPGRIQEEIRVDLTRPRDKDHPDFLRMRRQLHAALRP